MYRAEATDGRRAVVVQAMVPTEEPPWPAFKELPDDAFEAIILPKDLERACKVGDDFLQSKFRLGRVATRATTSPLGWANGRVACTAVRRWPGCLQASGVFGTKAHCPGSPIGEFGMGGCPLAAYWQMASHSDLGRHHRHQWRQLACGQPGSIRACAGFAVGIACTPFLRATAPNWRPASPLGKLQREGPSITISLCLAMD